MSTDYNNSSSEADSLYAAATAERRVDAAQQPLPWEYHYNQAGPRGYYAQVLPSVSHQVNAPMLEHQQQTTALRTLSGSSADGGSAVSNYTWHSNAHLQPPTSYKPSDFQHHETTPPPEAQFISASTISPQRISPAPHSAPVMVPSSRDLVRTPSPVSGSGADLLDDIAAYPPRHYQPQALAMSPERSEKASPNISLPRQPTQTPASFAAESALPSEDTSMRCTDFVAKLWFLLDRPEYRPHIRWNESGESFIFFPTTAFATDVLARLFKHSNVASFVRQLNLYGFQRISHLELLEDLSPSDHIGSDEADSSIAASGFSHPDFVRGRPQHLGKIRPKPSPSRARKTSGKRKARADDDDDEVSISRRRRH